MGQHSLMWWTRFVNRADAFAWQCANDKVCWYEARYQQLTPKHFEAHLAGVVTLGLPAIDQDGFCRWCCFDSDTADGSLDNIENLLIKHHWHCIREGQRPGRAGHLWLFFDGPVLASDLRLIGHRFIELAGVARNSIEFFPKQDMPTYDVEKQRFRVSSIVRLPLGIHRKPSADGMRGWFAGVEQDIEQQTEWITRQPLNPAAPVQKMVQELRQLALTSKAIKRKAHPISGTLISQTRDNPFKKQEVEAALTRIPADVTYLIWIRIGMALHNSGFPLEMFEQWSATGSKYEPGLCAQKWETFSADGNRKRVDIGTIFHYANESGKIS